MSSVPSVGKTSSLHSAQSFVAAPISLRDRQFHRPPLSKPIGDELFELRHVGKLNTRVLYFFMKGQRIVAAHAIRSKGQGIPARDRAVALERRRDWLARAKT